MNYDEFIGQVKDRAGLPSSIDAIKATQATLATIGERLPLQILKDLAAHLPRGIALFLQRHSGRSSRFGLREFYRLVGKREPADLPDAIYHARVVLSVLTDVLSLGEIEKILNALAPEFAPLFAPGAGEEFEKAA